MPLMAALSPDDPRMAAWTSYKATEEFPNTRRWAMHPVHVEGSMWAAFIAGFDAARSGAITEAAGGLPDAPPAEVVPCEAWYAALGVAARIADRRGAEGVATAIRALIAGPAPTSPTGPVIKAIERVLDECSAWIARPSSDVTMRVAIAAGIAWQAAMEHESNRIPDLETENAALRERNEKLVEGLRGVVSSHTWHERAPTPYVTFDSIQAENASKAAAIADARALLQGCDPIP